MNQGDTKKQTKESSNLLVYLVIFFFLMIVCLFVLTEFLRIWYENHQCVTNPNFWCADDYTCGTGCDGPGPTQINACFFKENAGPTGLASCLYGPSSTGATACIPNQTLNSPTDPACACNYQSGNPLNCLVTCPLSIANMPISACKCASTTQGGTCKQNPPS